MLSLFLVSMLIITVYTAVVVMKSGIPYSLSETYYRIEHKRGFSIAMLFTAFTLLPVGLEVSTEESQFLIFLSVVGMAIVALSPNFAHGEREEKIAHYIGSAILLVGTQTWVSINSPWALVCWVGYLAYIIYGILSQKDDISFFRKIVNLKPVFWAEVAVIVSTYISVLSGLIEH